MKSATLGNYREGQTIPLAKGWKMLLCMSDAREGAYLQGFVHSPCGKGSVSLAAARDLGETTDDWAIEIPAKVMQELADPEFDQFD